MITGTEKLILFNQYEILKSLNPNEAEYYEQNQKILEYGSDSDIEELTSSLTGTSEQISNETVEILNMFRELEYAYTKIFSSTNSKYEYSAMFKGFDGNEETDHYCYCKHLINHLNLFEEFKDRELNSHFPVINRYRKMLDYYNTIKNSRKVSFYKKPMTMKEFEFIIEG